MVGDDVIDLVDPEAWPGACHPRFESRVFTPAERATIAASRRPTCARWVHWAAKESAYKAARQRVETTVFAPRRFVVRLAAAGSGAVRHGADRFLLRVALDHEAVHAIAWHPAATGRLVADVARLPRPPTPAQLSAAARALAVQALAGALGVAAARLAIDRAAGAPPRLLLDGRPVRAALSLSHHGALVAFACLLTPAEETP
jgi:phosphopantetheinyl transferase (holo-ACP synthase)